MEASTKPKPTLKLKPKESSSSASSSSSSASSSSSSSSSASSGHKKKVDPVERKESRSEGGIVVIRVEGRKVEVEEREV